MKDLWVLEKISGYQKRLKEKKKKKRGKDLRLFPIEKQIHLRFSIHVHTTDQKSNRIEQIRQPKTSRQRACRSIRLGSAPLLFSIRNFVLRTDTISTSAIYRLFHRLSVPLKDLPENHFHQAIRMNSYSRDFFLELFSR